MDSLEEIARRLRCNIIKMIAEAASGHPGGSLSAVEIMTVLWFGQILRYRPDELGWEGRDRFILSKGHAAPVLYATMAEAGFIETSELLSLRKLDSRLQGHPDMLSLPGLEASTGSLGQGLSIATGMALGLGLDGGNQRVFCLLGDGECQEGQVWEAVMFAAASKLSNLVAIVDVNGLQIDGAVKDICDVGDLAAKFKQFGWLALEVNGHDMAALQAAFAEVLESEFEGPRVIIAHTVKGKGVSFMEDQAGWHGKAPSPEECRLALQELGEAHE